MMYAVRVHAPCRLHFGMFSFGHADRPRFGGVGVMIDPPAVEVRIRPAGEFRATGTLADRARKFAEIACARWQLPALPAFEVHVDSPPDHIGLGIGTQLGLSVAAGLRKHLGLSELPANKLAIDVGRAARSAVGTHGFQHGGLLVDAGHDMGQPIGTFFRRACVPDAWRFVLVSPRSQRGLAGAIEVDAFARLPPVPEAVTQELWRITRHEMLPALDRSDCAAFGEAVYRFGRVAGECFAAVQGGPFGSQAIAELIASIRQFGVPGVGQSSWGPTVFAVCPSEREAMALVEWLRGHIDTERHELTIAAPANFGARIDVDER